MPRRINSFAAFAAAALLLTAAAAPAQFPGQKTYCNPLDIDYKYNFEQQARGISFRSGADPVIVNHKGEYFLFVTISGGWWHSKDLVNWRFIKPDVSPHQWPRALNLTLHPGPGTVRFASDPAWSDLE